MSEIPQGITKKDVEDAIAALKQGEEHLFGASTGYDLVYEGERFPPKAVLGLAARRVLGRALGPYDFKGGLKSECFRTLENLEFIIERKPMPTGRGTDWSEDEIRALVEDYFTMLAMERRGERFNKAARIRELAGALSGRTPKSIEYKHQNVSGVLDDIGFQYIDGFKPAKNYQRQMFPEIVLEYVGAGDPHVQAIESSMDVVPDTAAGDVLGYQREVPAPPRVADGAARQPVPDAVRRARRFDFAARDAANRRLGKVGEERVLEYEKARLRRAGRDDLAARVDWSSESQGDGLGYDIESFDATNGECIYIEVKATNGGPASAFYLSSNELKASAQLGLSYRLYRVFNLSTAWQFFQLAGDMRDELQLTPRLYEARRR